MNKSLGKSYKTVRCILHSEDKFLLATHHHAKRPAIGKWGLPGGHTESGEHLEETVRRELMEELFVPVGKLYEVGDFLHNDRWHRIYGTRFQGHISSFDHKELKMIGWHTLEQVSQLKRDDQLHAGWEHRAIRKFLGMFPG